MSPQNSNRGVAARYSDIGTINIEDSTSKRGFLRDIDNMERSNDAIMNGQNRSAI